jgi:hypothetical protein
MKRIKLLWSQFLNLFCKKKPVRNNPIIARKRVMPGMKVWECDLATGEIVEAEISITPYVDSKGKSRKNRKVLIRKNCMYEYALNGENATRKFETRITSLLQKN